MCVGNIVGIEEVDGTPDGSIVLVVIPLDETPSNEVKLSCAANVAIVLSNIPDEIAAAIAAFTLLNVSSSSYTADITEKLVSTQQEDKADALANSSLREASAHAYSEILLATSPSICCARAELMTDSSSGP